MNYILVGALGALLVCLGWILWEILPLYSAARMRTRVILVRLQADVRKMEEEKEKEIDE